MNRREFLSTTVKGLAGVAVAPGSLTHVAPAKVGIWAGTITVLMSDKLLHEYGEHLPSNAHIVSRDPKCCINVVEFREVKG